MPDELSIPYIRISGIPEIDITYLVKIPAQFYMYSDFQDGAMPLNKIQGTLLKNSIWPIGTVSA